jgi:AraC-like DNA-binding protein
MDWSLGYRELAPPAALRPSVSCLRVWVVPSADEAATVVLPDACVDLIWEHGRGVYVAGPDTGPVPTVIAPGTVVAGVRFAPGAGGPALRMPMSALLNQRVDAGDLGSRPAAGLARRLPGSLAPDRAFRVLAEVAGALVDEGPSDALAAHAARLLSRPPVQAETVAGHLGVSERQLRRRCQASVGYGPATLRRVLRFRRFVSWADTEPGAGAPADGSGGDLAGSGADLARVAFELGYADQAHLTRECVRLAGVTPAALLAARRQAVSVADSLRNKP